MKSNLPRSLFPGACLAVLLAAPLALAAPKPAGNRLIRPCVPGEPAHAAALAELAAIDKAIEALAPAAVPDAVLARLARLASSKCFEIGGHFEVDAKTGFSLQTYWDDGGASNFREPLGLGGKTERWVYSPHSVRRAFTLETDAKSPLAHLLCRAADEACGAETAGWVSRAGAVFAAAGELQHLRHRQRGAVAGDEEKVCEAQARATPAHRRFATWRECIVAGAFGQTSLPLGHFRAPKEGWLLIEGRRGHYDFCDETRAYDLAEGSAYVIASCSALSLRSDGRVDGGKTDRDRQLRVKLGRLPVESLREAAWMLLFMDEVDRDVRLHGQGWQVPEWIEVVRPREDREGGAFHGSVVGGSTAQTTLRWRIIRPAGLVKAGTLTFPYDADPAEDHAVQLLQIAEAPFKDGCPPLAPPQALVDKPITLSANRLDADDESLVLASRTLAAAWQQALARQKACAR